MISQATYIWIDGTVPTPTLRSKVKMLPQPTGEATLKDFPDWNFDGSSTYQAQGRNSDLVLKPVYFVNDPIQVGANYLVLCEVMHPDGSPHVTNKRAQLREIMDNYGKDHDPWIGFEQEYTLFRGQQPLGWPDRGYPAPQGPFYCGVGADEVFGRNMVEEHAAACIEAGLMIYGTNAEVMPGQWEFQIGYRGLKNESPDPLTVCDNLWIARWLLYRIGEDYDINARLHPKPVKGDWNGAGMHTNFSTQLTRDPEKGKDAIYKAVKALEKNHDKHIQSYGADLELRLTGHHETAPIDKFSFGVADRSSSVRIPHSVEKLGCGYIEDRRPGANANPYEVAALLVESICSSE